MDYGSTEDNPNLTVIVSDFEQGNRGGVASGGTPSNLAVAQDYKNQQLTEGIVVHELGHKFGLPHARTSRDIMSYSGISAILRLAGRPYFSGESRYNWWKKKQEMEK
jgi:hypothetical protein